MKGGPAKRREAIGSGRRERHTGLSSSLSEPLGLERNLVFDIITHVYRVWSWSPGVEHASIGALELQEEDHQFVMLSRPPFFLK